jgi:hypothetical protein
MSIRAAAPHPSLVRTNCRAGRRTTMSTTTAAPLSIRDKAVLRAVAAGRCELSGAAGGVLIVDGLCFADQFAGPRLASAGLIAPAAESGHAMLTASGLALLAAA